MQHYIHCVGFAKRACDAEPQPDSAYCAECKQAIEGALIDPPVGPDSDPVPPPWEVHKLPNQNILIRVGGATRFCGSIETAHILHDALDALFLSYGERADIDRLVERFRKVAA